MSRSFFDCVPMMRYIKDRANMTWQETIIAGKNRKFWKEIKIDWQEWLLCLGQGGGIGWTRLCACLRFSHFVCKFLVTLKWRIYIWRWFRLTSRNSATSFRWQFVYLKILIVDLYCCLFGTYLSRKFSKDSFMFVTGHFLFATPLAPTCNYINSKSFQSIVRLTVLFLSAILNFAFLQIQKTNVVSFPAQRFSFFYC